MVVGFYDFSKFPKMRSENFVKSIDSKVCLFACEIFV